NPYTEFDDVIDPDYPSNPPSSTKALPIPPRHSPIPNNCTTVVFYNPLTEQDATNAWREAELAPRVPLTGPQPHTFPGGDWRENFAAGGSTRHYFVIADGDEDVLAPWIRYDMDSPLPLLQATLGLNCHIYSRPLHARSMDY